MAEDSGQEKTEEPTARRLDKAREEGQVARSRELSAVSTLIVGGEGKGMRRLTTESERQRLAVQYSGVSGSRRH